MQQKPPGAGIAIGAGNTRLRSERRPVPAGQATGGSDSCQPGLTSTVQHFTYLDGRLQAERVPLAAIVERYGTPCYVYSRAAIEQQWRAYDQAFEDRRHLICYAVKANSNIAVLNLLARLGSGFDIVSGGELERVVRAGGLPACTVFSGVGKQAGEIERALQAGIKCFNVESRSELLRLNGIAGSLRRQAPVALRINPDVDAQTHPYIATGLDENKFGIPYREAPAVYELARSLEHIRVTGIACHIGSQIINMAPFIDAINLIAELVEQLQKSGFKLGHIDIGGGLGICYQDELPPTPAEYTRAICGILARQDVEILIEPGRSIVGNAGVLLTRVEYLKQNKNKHFAVIDAAMNDLLRPALYSVWQEILPLTTVSQYAAQRYDLVGPVCETGDFIGLDRELALGEGDLLAISSAGAYGFCMSSNYNTRPRVAEIMVDGDRIHEIRRRETVAELLAAESLLPG